MAFVGRSNVGKSSLLNSIVRRKALARISKHPGKTRDCVVFRVAKRLYLLDLPGYGYARVSQTERIRFAQLIESILADRSQLAGVVWLLDIRRDPSDEDILLGQKLLAHETPVLVALTKGDKLNKSQRERRVALIQDALGLPLDQIILTSSVTKEGIETLRETILAVAYTP